MVLMLKLFLILLQPNQKIHKRIKKMKHYHLILVSKTKESLNDFFGFLNNTFLNSSTIKKYFKNKKRRKILTILKSPHVYKTAQEQFQSIFFLSQVTIYSNKSYQFLVFLKKIKNSLFPDIKIKVVFPVNENLLNKTQTNIINPTNFKLNILQKYLNQKIKVKKYQKKNYKQIENLLKVYDLYGELVKKQK